MFGVVQEDYLANSPAEAHEAADTGDEVFAKSHRNAARHSAATQRKGAKTGGTGLINFKVKGRGINLVMRDEIEGPYEKTRPYKQFGNYLINTHKLDQNIVMIRHASGKVHKDLPTHKVSQNVANIVKSVAGGLMPHYDHIAGLSKPEQEQLHKTFSICKVEQNPIPKPMMKSADKAEMDRFDILRGQVLAGNDNKTLVRELKVLIMKLMLEKKLPRREATEVLVELTSMGF